MANLRERFEGDHGRVRLIEALRKQDVVQYDGALAAALADAGAIVTLSPGQNIVTQGGSDNSVFFLLAGEASLLVHDRVFGMRGEGTCIGEMAAIDASAKRAATIQATSDMVALEVQEPAFRKALDDHPMGYKALAQLLAQRLRERSHFIRPPNARPIVFVGSSAEAVSLANELQAGFKHDPFDAIVWPNGVFGPGGVAFDSLEQMAERADFAAFVISPDDTVLSRDNEQPAPRDNVIFELGLFMGHLARERVFLVKEQSSDVKIPSDLLGVTPVTYVLKDGASVEAAIAPACHEIRKAIKGQGPR
jgi:CRP/FNR family cyclic AMP-dependent transcriptional regulator